MLSLGLSLDKKHLEKIDVDTLNYKSSEDHTALISKDNKQLVLTTKDFTMPKDILEIADFACSYTNNKIIEIPEGVTKVGMSFTNCGDVDEVRIPESLLSLHSGCFINTNVKKFVVSKDNPIFYTNEAQDTLYCRKHASYPSSIFYLGRNALIPEGTIALTAQVFSAKGHKKVYIPSTLCTFPFNASFDNELESIECSKDNPFWSSKDNCLLSKDGTKLLLACKLSKIPESVTCIKAGAFASVESLDELHIGKNVNRIERGAFNKNIKVKHISVDKDNKVFDSRDNCNAVIISECNYAILIGENAKLPDGVRVPNTDELRNLASINRAALVIPLKLDENGEPENKRKEVDSDDEMPF